MFKTKFKKSEVVMMPPRVSIIGTLKRIPLGQEAAFSFNDLSRSIAAVRAAATRLNKSGRYGRFTVNASLERQMYFISRI